MNENSVVSLRQKDEIDDPLTEILRTGARRLITRARNRGTAPVICRGLLCVRYGSQVRRYAVFRLPGAFSRHQFSADYHHQYVRGDRDRWFQQHENSRRDPTAGRHGDWHNKGK